MTFRLRILSIALASFGCHVSWLNASRVEHMDDFTAATLDQFWEQRIEIPGSSITQSGGVLTIDSPISPSTFADTSIDSVGRYGDADFTASVDFRVPQGNAMAWLSVVQDPSVAGPHVYGAYFFNGTDYRTWLNDGTFVGNRFEQLAFGDERTKWHNLKISYDVTNKMASAFIDDERVSMDAVDLTNSFIRLNMKDRDTYGPGPTSIQFDNFRLVTASMVPEPSMTLALLSGFSVVMMRRRQRASR